MVTVSLCMIVKNEERLLSRCLDSFRPISDEIIIVDTGSEDRTKEIAARYTDRIYDFPWQDDFSKARNFAFSKATKDYIYTCDADEILDGENLERFRRLKAILLPEIEIVQMKYDETGVRSDVLNVRTEYRPKLYKRMRSFIWIDPVHETVRTEPVVFDSDIVILHRPSGNHAPRDFSIFEKAYRRDHYLSPRIFDMFLKELWRAGTARDLSRAAEILTDIMEHTSLNPPLLARVSILIARARRMEHNIPEFFKYILKAIVISGKDVPSEACFELGEFYAGEKDYAEASLWFYNAAYETAPVIDVHAGGDAALARLADSEADEAVGEANPEKKQKLLSSAAEHRRAAAEWEIPAGDG